MKTRVASSQATKELRAMGAFKKRNISAYIVRIEGEEDIPFEFYTMAMACAGKKAKSGKVAKVMENAGNQCFVELTVFEKDPGAIIEEVKEFMQSRHNTACAIGKTHMQRWQNAVQNIKVPILVRKG